MIPLLSYSVSSLSCRSCQIPPPFVLLVYLVLQTGQIVWEDLSPGTSGFSLAHDGGDNMWVATWQGLRRYSRKVRLSFPLFSSFLLFFPAFLLWEMPSRNSISYNGNNIE